ncbi:Bacteriohemerythrin [Candidatus Magnetaquicoccaceae bacterium FCR-1]|uniref:Bacteriohemerythrin n=1 Tax=Candidatus Magnetaquiglobus chichijimensis TaxID=3141448 RepID=A0ABQ0CCP1_9PROT
MKSEFHSKLLASMADVGEPRFNLAHEKLFNIVVDADEILGAAVTGERSPTPQEWESLSTVCDELIVYAKAHFADEEETLIHRNYPNAAQHRTIHNQLIEQLNEFQRKVTEGNDKDLKELRRWMLEWLLNHVNREDHAFAQFFATVE